MSHFIHIVAQLVVLLIAVALYVVLDPLCILLMVWEYAQTSKETLTHLENVKIIPAVKTAE